MSQPMQHPQAEQQWQQQVPPAPASDRTLAAAPEFIVPGQWDDAEWRAVAAKPAGQRTEHEQYIWAGGPRPHPWGRAAFMGTLPGGAQAAFPSKAAFNAYQATEAGKAQEDAAKAQGTLDALARGLHDGGTVKPASDPDQADKMLEAASPNGVVAPR